MLPEDMHQAGIQDTGQDEQKLQPEAVMHRKRPRIGRKHGDARDDQQKQSPCGGRHHIADHRRQRQGAQRPQQAEIEQADTAQEQDKPRQMSKIGDRIGENGATHERSRRRGLDSRRGELRQGRRHQRSSTVLPSAVMRSARISGVPSRRG